MRVRVSAGTAAVLGLCPGGGEVAPTAAYLMIGESCARSCGFCAQARGSTTGAGKLSRVTWPGFELQDVLARLGPACTRGEFTRVCVQTVAGPGSTGELSALLGELRPAVGVPVSASVYVRDLAQLEQLFSAGLGRAGLALDAASPGTYRDIKGGSLAEAQAFLERAAGAFPGKIGTHLIAGLGETEEELLTLVQWCADRAIVAGLFAFTPVRGTRLASHRPPDLKSYRRVQAAAALVGRDELRVDGMGFTSGRLTGLELDSRRLRAALRGGDAFRTTGCPGCNRPYYNERPGRVPYNYPRPLSRAEEEMAIAQVLDLASDAEPAPGAGLTGDAAPAVPGGGNGV